MTGFSREAVAIHLNKGYSTSKLAGNFLLAIGLFVFWLAFPSAFDVIDYPAWVALAIVFGSAVAYSVTYVWVHADLKRGRDPMEIIRGEQIVFYARSLIVLVFVPSFGARFANLLWFVPAFVAAEIFSSAHVPSTLKRLACLGPFVSLVVHYTYWNLGSALAGASGWFGGKPIQPVEIGFACIMVGLLFQARRNLEDNSRLTANITLDQRIIEGYVSDNGLSLRESEILYKVLQGASTKEIAESLFIEAGTVRNHLSSVFRKTGTHSRMELAASAYVRK